MVQMKKRIYALILLSLIFIILFSFKNEVFAGTTFSDFRTNKNIFCLNRGQSFSDKDSGYNKIKDKNNNTIAQFVIDGEKINPDTYTPPDSYSKLLDFLKLPGNEANFYKIAYILLKNNNVEGKTSIGGSPTQVAMWMVTSPKKELPPASKPFIETGKQLYVESCAYAQWIENYAKDGKKLILGGTPQLDNGYIGPFTLTYTERVSVSDKGKTGYYGGISMKINDSSVTCVYIKKNGVFSKLNNSDSNLNAIVSGETQFYIKKPASVTGTSAQVTITQKQKIKATFEIYHSSNNQDYYQAKIDGTTFQIIPETSINKIFCMNCMDYHNPYNPTNGRCYYCGKPNGACDHTPAGLTNADFNFYNNEGCRLLIEKSNGNNYHGATYVDDDGNAMGSSAPGADFTHINSASLLLKRQNLLKYKGDATQQSGSTNGNVTIIAPLELHLKKTNTLGDTLTGAKFQVTATQEGIIKPLYSGNEISLPIDIKIEPQNTKKITITIKETTTPNNHIGLGTITITYTYNSSSNSWTSSSSGDYFSVSGSTITLKNRPKADLKFYKKDDLTDNAIEGAKFQVTIDDGVMRPTTKTYTTDKNGKISIDNIPFQIKGSDYCNIVVTIEELAAPTDSNGRPTYKLLDGPITVTIKYDRETTSPKIISCVYNGVENVSYSGTNISVTAKDKPIIHLGGKVWLDKQQGGKPVEAPNGAIDSNEEGIAGVPVYLFKTEDGKTTQVTKDIYGNDLPTETDSSGNYKFENLPKLKDGNYKIFFSYDGVNYIATVDGTSQKVAENTNIGDVNIRTAFNSRFQRIVGVKYIDRSFNLSNSGSISVNNNLDEILEYDTHMGETGLYKSKLITTGSHYNFTDHENGQPKFVEAGYKMFARTKTTYNTTSMGINLGLQKRMVDMSLQADVYEAKVSINGKTTVYDYDEIIATDGQITINSSTGENISYTKGVDGNGKQYTLNLYKSDFNANITDPLKVEVTYAIAVNNQGIINLYKSGLKAKVFSIANYHDENYTLKSAKLEVGTSDGGTQLIDLNYNTSGTATIDGKTYKRAVITKGTDFISELKEGSRSIIYLTYDVNGRGDNIAVGEYNNFAEIIEYGTDDGLVDRDSVPNNITSYYEDDSDRAIGLKIQVVDEQRQIEGNVWEDAKGETGSDGTYKYGNGVKDSSEQGIKGVKVELISTGSETIPLPDAVYTDDSGKYTIEGFIPGDYIVKFTYGNQPYNGVDYKSGTVSVLHYDVYMGNREESHEYYNYLYNMYGNDSDGNVPNKAMDSAKRRLALIAEYSEMDKAKYMEYTSPTSPVEMFADTPKIFVAVDENINLFSSDLDGTTEVNWNEINLISIRNVNMCIEKRPETKLSLEEHIKRLTLKGNDGVPLVQARVDSEDDLFNSDVEVLTDKLSGIKDGLKAWKTKRESMGKWQIETDISEVIQGADIETEVVYQVKNESETDYLGATLVDYYKNQSISNYKTIINMLANNSSNNDCIDYLGKTYYTGIIDGNVAKVPAKVGKVQDYVNDLEFRSGAGIAKINTENVVGTYEKATALETIDITNGYTKVLDLYNNGNQLMKDAEGNFITVVKDGDQYYKVVTQAETIRTVIQKQDDIGLLNIGQSNRFNAVFGINGLAPNGKLDFDNYIAEIMSYSTASGRPDKLSIPGNLDDKYVYSQDNDITLEASERDEFQGEVISIVPPTGENKINLVIMVSAIAGGMAVIALGVVLIKKYVIK